MNQPDIKSICEQAIKQMRQDEKPKSSCVIDGYFVKKTSKNELDCAKFARRQGVPTPEPCRCPESEEDGTVYISFGHIPGKNLEEIYRRDFNNEKRLNDKTRLMFKKAAEILANIHSKTNEYKGCCDEQFKIEREEEEMKNKLCKIKSVNLPSKYQDLVECAEKMILEIIKNIFSDGDVVFHHGDYKLDNIIVNSDDDLVIVDWEGAGWGSRWYDIAYLLADIDTHSSTEAQKILRHYMSEAHLEKDVEDRFRYARIYQEIIRIHSNVDGRNDEQFNVGLKNLKRLVSGIGDSNP